KICSSQTRFSTSILLRLALLATLRFQKNLILGILPIRLSKSATTTFAVRFNKLIAVRRRSRPRQASISGGGEGIRTPDPMVANHVLCQLSYTPGPRSKCIRLGFGGPGWIRTTDLTLIRGAL